MAVRRRNKDPEALIRRAHLGSVTNAEDIIELAKQYGLKTAPLDLESLMEKLGISVVYSKTLEKNVSGILNSDLGKWTCTINDNHHKSRQRFTLAHELAHYILHRGAQSKFIDETFFRGVDSLDKMELEANQFAAFILMPESEFRLFVRTRSANVDAIATHFGVSPPAVRVRARQLGFTA